MASTEYQNYKNLITNTRSEPSFITNLQSAFRSQRLEYKALENNDTDKAFFYKLHLDPLGAVQTNDTIFRPPKQNDADSILQYLIQNSLICVKICLPQEAKEGNEINSGFLPIGFIFLSGHNLVASQHRDATLGVQIIDGYRGQGYGSEAINWIIDWGFRFANLHRIGLSCFSFNTGAVKVYGRLGFVIEGRKREAHYLDRQWHDIISFSMLESEWLSLQA